MGRSRAAPVRPSRSSTPASRQTHPDLAANVAPGARSLIPTAGRQRRRQRPRHERGGRDRARSPTTASASPASRRRRSVLSLKALDTDGDGNSALIARRSTTRATPGVRVVEPVRRARRRNSLDRARRRSPTPPEHAVRGRRRQRRRGRRTSATTSTCPRAATAARSTRATTRWPTCICVGASDANGRGPAWSNNGGDERRPVRAGRADLHDPATRRADAHVLRSERGTSMAAPMVAAEAGADALRPVRTSRTASLRTLPAAQRRSDSERRGPLGRPVGARTPARSLDDARSPDRDGDGVLDELDNCPDHADPTHGRRRRRRGRRPCDSTPRGDDADGDSKAVPGRPVPDRVQRRAGRLPARRRQPAQQPTAAADPDADADPTRPPSPASVVKVGVKVTPKRARAPQDVHEGGEGDGEADALGDRVAALRAARQARAPDGLEALHDAVAERPRRARRTLHAASGPEGAGPTA